MVYNSKYPIDRPQYPCLLRGSKNMALNLISYRLYKQENTVLPPNIAPPSFWQQDGYFCTHSNYTLSLLKTILFDQ